MKQEMNKSKFSKKRMELVWTKKWEKKWNKYTATAKETVEAKKKFNQVISIHNQNWRTRVWEEENKNGKINWRENQKRKEKNQQNDRFMLNKRFFISLNELFVVQ